LPELPEVETTLRGISPHILGKSLKKVVIRNRQLRWPVDDQLEEKLTNKKLQQLSRRGKYLLLQFNHGTALWHLGMSGSLCITNSKQPVTSHDHVDWVFNKNTILRFNDPRRFGCLLWTTEPPEEHKLLASLGPEPLSEEFDGNYLFRHSRKRSKPLKSWLMDSKTVVGVGNIYANEALYKSKLHPLKKTGTISAKKCEILVENIKQTLKHAIQQGGTTLKDFVGGDGKPGYFAQELQVYGRGGQSCNRCELPLKEIRLNQRATVFCSSCQKK